MTGPRFIECPGCAGDCSVEHLDGGYDPRDGSPTGFIGVCLTCMGRGSIEIDDEPITIEDMDEQP
jgi:hypothetical protein